MYTGGIGKIQSHQMNLRRPHLRLFQVLWHTLLPYWSQLIAQMSSSCTRLSFLQVWLQLSLSVEQIQLGSRPKHAVVLVDVAFLREVLLADLTSLKWSPPLSGAPGALKLRLV